MKTKVKNFIAEHFTAILIGLLVASTFCITGVMIQNIKNSIDGDSIIRSPASITKYVVPAIAMGEQYIVREYDGRIGVFISGDTQPIKVLQVYVAYLPEADRVDLREGIYVTGTRALERVLNDFRS